MSPDVLTSTLSYLGLVCAGYAILGVPLIMSIIYVWARNFPDQQVCSYPPARALPCSAWHLSEWH
jgi:hypothetical protein